jgi:hypothetical protein
MRKRRDKPISQGKSDGSADFFESCSSSVEMSDLIKEWLANQDAVRPFGLNWPIRRRLEAELTHFGFERVKVIKMEAHEVFVVNGTPGTSQCRTEADLHRIFKRLANILGFSTRAADMAVSFSRHSFQAVLYLPSDLRQ